VPRDLGRAEIGGKDLASELLANGWAKLKEIKREPTEDDLKRREIEAEAKAAGKGVWNPHGQQVCIGLMLAMDRTEYTCHRPGQCITPCPRTPKPSLMSGKGRASMVLCHIYLYVPLLTSLTAIVEQVRDGTTLRTRLLMPDGDHQVVNIALAGVRSPKASAKQGETSEPWGEEVSLVYSLLYFMFTSEYSLGEILH
jgi:staphylococcal nuclease domain-containing protein 1